MEIHENIKRLQVIQPETAGCCAELSLQAVGL
jgi:hypothetical protein